MRYLGVQIWVKDIPVKGGKAACSICEKEIGQEPFYIPAAGPVLLNQEDRIHEHCADAIELLPMQTNDLIVKESVEEI